MSSTKLAPAGGKQPIGFSATTLLQVDLPLDWAEERVALGFG